jgi:hypothetical protein
MKWIVKDEITCETKVFTNKKSAQEESKRRLEMHKNGYNIRHQHVYGCDAIMVERDEMFIITIRKGNNK